MSRQARPSNFQDCAHCGRPIVHPEPLSYPPTVRWVHILSPVGEGNRHCDTTSGMVAGPKREEWDAGGKR